VSVRIGSNLMDAPNFGWNARATCPDGALPTTISQSVSYPRHHNVIQSVSFKTIVFEKLHVIARIPSSFKLGRTSHSAVRHYIQNRSYVSDATTEVVSEFTKVLPLSTYQTKINKR